MRIEGANSALTNLRNAPKVGGRGGPVDSSNTKSIGEKPPIPVSLAEIGTLAALFAKGGTISKLARRLNKLKRKNNRVTPAKGTIACVDADGLVYLGVEFLEENHDKEDILAGVMAHEWGHTCAVKPTKEELEKSNWDEIFEMRRSHEVLADELSGRLMAMMGYDPERFIAFLHEKARGTHNLKYHDNDTRAEIVRQGHRDELRKMNLARDLFPSKNKIYRNDYDYKLIDDDV